MNGAARAQIPLTGVIAPGDGRHSVRRRIAVQRSGDPERSPARTRRRAQSELTLGRARKWIAFGEGVEGLHEILDALSRRLQREGTTGPIQRRRIVEIDAGVVRGPTRRHRTHGPLHHALDARWSGAPFFCPDQYDAGRGPRSIHGRARGTAHDLDRLHVLEPDVVEARRTWTSQVELGIIFASVDAKSIEENERRHVGHERAHTGEANAGTTSLQSRTGDD